MPGHDGQSHLQGSDSQGDRMTVIRHSGDELLAEREVVIRRDPAAAAKYIVAVEGEAESLRQQLEGAVDLLATFVDDEACSFDHHGYCQAHGWLDEGECNVARARRLIGGQ